MPLTNPVEPCAEYAERFYDLVVGDSDDEARQAFARHCVDCAPCAAALADVQAVVGLAMQPLPELPADYWSAFASRIDERLAADGASAALPARDRTALPHRMRRASGLWSRTVARVALGAVLLAFGIAIGRGLAPSPEGQETGMAILQPASLDLRTMQYLQRSGVLLQGLANFEAGLDDPAGIDLPSRREAARALLDEAAELNDALDAEERRQLRALMTDLERVLLQIANMEADVDLPSIELVQRGVDQGALLLKINLARMRMVEARVATGSPPTEL